jgi:hypothetical protein
MIAIPLIIGAVAAAYSANASYQQGKAAAQMYANEAATTNDVFALQQANIQRQSVLAQGKAAALYSASGVTLDGSPTDVLGQTAGNYERTKFDANFVSQAQATSEMDSSRNALYQGKSQAIGTLLNYTASAARMGYGASGGDAATPTYTGSPTAFGSYNTPGGLRSGGLDY